MRERSYTEGSILKGMLRFSIPYLISCFLQTFYGMADLFITGQFNASDAISAVAIGSQLMHMLTVVIVGLAMGSTVIISRNVGADKKQEIAVSIGNTGTLFCGLAALLTVILLLLVNPIIGILSTPPEAVTEAHAYLVVCFAGIPFITAYNVISSIFRGLGDTRRPMIFVAIAGVLNIGLDFFFIGPLGMSARGAALATVISQAVSVLLAGLSLARYDIGIQIQPKDFIFQPRVLKMLLLIGLPIAFQDGLIQISFLIITKIANSRGVDVAAAVGIVEKIISFLFLVPSAMLSTVSALAAQNAGAGKHRRGRKVLRYGVTLCLAFGAFVFVICQFASPWILSLFVQDDPNVVLLGAQYLRSYSLDCVFAGVHFCFSGYFSAYNKSIYSFLHNILSIVTMRIPGAYLASVFFPATLYPMGLAAPLGSLLSALICLLLYRRGKKYWI